MELHSHTIKQDQLSIDGGQIFNLFVEEYHITFGKEPGCSDADFWQYDYEFDMIMIEFDMEALNVDIFIPPLCFSDSCAPIIL